MYIVVDDNHFPLRLYKGHRWNGGKVLFVGTKRATVFEKYNDAKRAIKQSKKYAIEKGISLDWQTDKWKVVSLDPAE